MASQDVEAEKSAFLLSLIGTSYETFVQFHALGMGIALFTGGWITLQTTRYLFNRKNSDHWSTKMFIAAMVLLLYAQQACTVYVVWQLIGHFDGFGSWYISNNFFTFLELVLSGTMGPLAMFFVGLRTYRLYGRPKVAGTLGLLAILALFSTAMASAITGFQIPIDVNAPTMADFLASFDPIWSAEVKKRLIVYFAVGIAVNIIVASLMLAKYKRFLLEEPGRRTSIIIKVFRMILESLVPAAIVSVLLGSFIVSGLFYGTWIITIAHVQPSLYCAACLASVNARRGIQQNLISHNIQISVPNELRKLYPVGTTSQNDIGTSSHGSVTQQYDSVPLMSSTSGAEMTQVDSRPDPSIPGYAGGHYITYSAAKANLALTQTKSRTEKEKEKAFYDSLPIPPRPTARRKSPPRLDEHIAVAMGKSSVSLRASDAEKGIAL